MAVIIVFTNIIVILTNLITLKKFDNFKIKAFMSRKPFGWFK